MRRAVLYLRVSTIDQTTANQERQLREIAGRMGCRREQWARQGSLWRA
jgi:DNA invertase Pin-like site-specific DNA recombinase